MTCLNINKEDLITKEHLFVSNEKKNESEIKIIPFLSKENIKCKIATHMDSKMFDHKAHLL